MAEKNPTRRGNKFIDITGKVFGRLTVLLYSHTRGHCYWNCQCECGNLTVVNSRDLRNGHTKSCGCLSSEVTACRNTTHGHHRRDKTTKTYRAWKNMKDRCSNPKNPRYARYGGRRITVCNRWQNSYENFFADIGEAPSPEYSIDRIDNDGHYSCGKCEQCVDSGWPTNLRWSTNKEQRRNFSRNHLITVGNETRTLIEWAERSGIKHTTIGARLRKGWPPEKAVFAPLHR